MSSTDVTLEAAIEIFYEDLRGRNLCADTVTRYRCTLEPFRQYAAAQGITRLADCEVEMVRAWRNQLHQAASTQGIMLGQVKRFFRFCVEMGKLPRDPAAGLRSPKFQQRPTRAFPPPRSSASWTWPGRLRPVTMPCAC